MSECSVKDCGKEASRQGQGLCRAHHQEKHKGGYKPTTTSHGYLTITCPDHPLSDRWSKQYQHRIVYYDANGVGPFLCHWCATEVTWATLHVDHVDDDKKNNHISNLVASCALCNQQRGNSKNKQTWRNKSGVTLRGETLTLNEWASRVGISRASILSRVKNGWSMEDAVFKPRGKFGPRAKTNEDVS